jgi:hypothetical protein
MTHGCCRRAVLAGDAIRICRDGVDAIGIAHRAIQHVKAEQGNPRFNLVLMLVTT